MLYITWVGGEQDVYKVTKLTKSEMIWFTDDDYEEYPDGLIYFKKVK